MMAYGKLDVYWPDGPIESYQLEKPSIAIGRSTGNDIVLDTTAVSRYHISLTRKDQDVFLEDLESVNGTYLDGERIKAHDPIVLHGGEEIQLGDIRLIYMPQDESEEMPTQPIFLEQNVMETRRIELSQPTFKVELDPPTQPVTPGVYVQASLTIYNSGSEPDRFTIDFDGVPKTWIRTDRSEMEIPPGGNAAVLISFKPLRRSESAPGKYTVKVRVHAKSGQSIDIPMILTLRAYSGFGIVMGTPRIDSATPFEVYLHNQGSEPLPLLLSGAAPGDDLVFAIQPSQITLAAGEQRSVKGYVRSAHQPLLGKTRERRFDILARAQNPSGFLAAVQGVLLEKPALPQWVPTVVVPAMIILVLAAVIGSIAFLSRPRTPVITSLVASAASLTEGDAVTLTWAATDTSEVTVQLDNAAPVTVDPPANTYTQTMTGVGTRTFSVVAHNGGESAVQEVQVVVNPALKVNAFVITPNPLLRNVRQNINLSWDVDGANNIRFVGLEALTGKPDDRTQPAVGQITLTGTPRDSVELKLVATGTDGKQTDQSVRVEIQNPTCKVTADKTKVYAGPGTNYPVTNTLAANSNVGPDGRDASGKWIHLAPAPDLQAWLDASTVTCTDFTPDALTAIMTTPVPPSVTPTQTPTSAPPTATTTLSPTPAATKTAQSLTAPSKTPTAPPTHTSTAITHTPTTLELLYVLRAPNPKSLSLPTP
ncbi:MAG: FHA domain-containing protein [Chloroflexota bacterium]